MLHCSILIKKEILQRIIYLPIGRRKMKQNRYVTSQNLQVSCKNFTGRKSKIHTPLLRRFGGFTFSFFFVLHHLLFFTFLRLHRVQCFLSAFPDIPPLPPRRLQYILTHTITPFLLWSTSILYFLQSLFFQLSSLCSSNTFSQRVTIAIFSLVFGNSCIFFFLLILQICSISSTSIPINLYSSRFC